MIEVCATILVYNQGMISWVEKSGSQPPGKATSTVSTKLQSMCEVLRINLNGISGYDFFPSRLPWPLCPWQLPFLRLLDFQSVKVSSLLDQILQVMNWEQKYLLVAVSNFIQITSETQLHITFCFSTLFHPWPVQVPECC